MFSLVKNILFALALAGILWIGYKVFFASNTASLTAVDASVTLGASRDTQEFLRTLQQLRDITLNGKIFDDVRLQSFVDYRQTIISEPVGRQNPFAPIGK
jgi:cell division protein YceG involved in septum cleavage